MDKQAALVRDEFNLNKILIVVTSVGKVLMKDNSEKKEIQFFLKVFGILTQSGGILWKHYFNNFAAFEHFHTLQVPLFHIRSATHYTHQPLASIVYRDRVRLISFFTSKLNPII
jgi:hypothetical protein